jgi:hypothetical protein
VDRPGWWHYPTQCSRGHEWSGDGDRVLVPVRVPSCAG